MRDDRGLSVTRVLLVEDHELFRRFIRSTLETRQDFTLVSEAADGLEAVHKCLELQPDVVILDIGLPGLSGIEAARRIRSIVPACKIVFLTQESSADVVQEALRLGAAGYVIKVRAAGDLVPALIAAREGQRFVSSGVAGVEPCCRQRVEPGKGQLEAALPRNSATHNHEIHFYPDDASFVAGFASFVERSLKARRAVLALIGESHRSEILRILETSGIHVSIAIEAGHFVPLDAAEVREEFMVNDRVDPVRLWRTSTGLLETLMESNPGVPISICGEGAFMLLALGNGEAALEVERVWDQIAMRYGVEVCCPYLTGSYMQDRGTYEQIRAAHSGMSVH